MDRETEIINRLGRKYRGVLFEFHLKFWNNATIGIPPRSLLKGRQTSNWSSCSTIKKEQLLDGIQIKHL